MPLIKTGGEGAPDLQLIVNPAPLLLQAVLRIRADAKTLKNTLTAAEVRAVFLILEEARDHLSDVLERGKFK